MRLSRLGIFVLVALVGFLAAGCGPYNQIMARKNLVDGSKAYKDRKFPEAAELFKAAAARDPEGNTLEGRTAQLSLARTLHSMYIGNRIDKSLAESALAEYKKSLPQSLKELTSSKAAYEKTPTGSTEQRNYLTALTSVDSTTSAIASLYENIEQPDQAKQWLTTVAGDAQYPETARARSLSTLAGKQNTCANDISDAPATKKTVKKDGKDTFQFVKPANPADFTKLKECVDEGVKLTDQTLTLEGQVPLVASAATLDTKAASDSQLAIYSEVLKSFESARSYRASILVQAMRYAEMDGRTADADKLKQDAEAARNRFKELSDVVRKVQQEIDDRTAAKEEAEKGAAANANGTKK